MRTSIEIDDKLLETAMKMGKQPSKKATIEKALQCYIDRQKKQKLLHIRHKGFWKGDLNEMRKS